MKNFMKQTFLFGKIFKISNLMISILTIKILEVSYTILIRIDMHQPMSICESPL